jgi:hypothetical protein
MCSPHASNVIKERLHKAVPLKKHFLRVVGAAVIYNYYLKIFERLLQHAVNCLNDNMCPVEYRYDNTHFCHTGCLTVGLE